MLTAMVSLSVTVREMVADSRRFARRNLRDAGTNGPRPPPVTDELIVTARKVLRPGETWSLRTPAGLCLADGRAFFWVAFRLMPNYADCQSPDVKLLWKVDLEGELVTSGLDFVIAR